MCARTKVRKITWDLQAIFSTTILCMHATPNYYLSMKMLVIKLYFLDLLYNKERSKKKKSKLPSNTKWNLNLTLKLVSWQNIYHTLMDSTIMYYKVISWIILSVSCNYFIFQLLHFVCNRDVWHNVEYFICCLLNTLISLHLNHCV